MSPPSGGAVSVEREADERADCSICRDAGLLSFFCVLIERRGDEDTEREEDEEERGAERGEEKRGEEE